MNIVKEFVFCFFQNENWIIINKHSTSKFWEACNFQRHILLKSRNILLYNVILSKSETLKDEICNFVFGLQ